MQQNEQKELYGWKEITAHLGMSRDAIIRRCYPIYKRPYAQEIYAFKDELDAHTQRIHAERIPISVKAR